MTTTTATELQFFYVVVRTNESVVRERELFFESENRAVVTYDTIVAALALQTVQLESMPATRVMFMKGVDGGGRVVLNEEYFFISAG